MAVTLDANSSADGAANAVTSLTSTNLTIGSGSQRALVVQIALQLHGAASRTVTWDSGGTNQATALIIGADNTGTNGRSELWGLVAPTSGAKTLKAAWTGSSDCCMNGVSWTGVDQTGGATSFPHSTSATGSSASASVTITSASGNAAMDATVNDAGTFFSPSQTQTYNDSSLNTITGAGSRAAGAASVIFSWSLGSSANWVSVGTDILAAGAASDTQEWMPRVFPRNQRDVNILY